MAGNSKTRPPNDRSKIQRRKGKSDDGAIGSALRAAYQNTVEEQIPDTMLDLLGKLS